MVLLGRDLLTRLCAECPGARTAVAVWAAVAAKAAWSSQEEVQGHFPTAKFLTPSLATFQLTDVNCALTAQIAFNTGIVIVLSISSSVVPIRSTS